MLGLGSKQNPGYMKSGADVCEGVGRSGEERGIICGLNGAEL